MALLGEQFDAVGGEQLVVADRGRDRARARPRGAQSRLHVVIAVAAGLERIDPHRLLARQPRRRGDAGIGALELDLAGGPLRRELEMLRRGLQEIGDHRNGFALARLFFRLAAPAKGSPDASARCRPAAASARSHRARSAGGRAAWRCGRAASRQSNSNRRRLPARTPRALPDIPSACGDIPRSPAATPPAPSRSAAGGGSVAASWPPPAARSAAAQAREIRGERRIA